MQPVTDGPRVVVTGPLVLLCSWLALTGCGERAADSGMSHADARTASVWRLSESPLVTIDREPTGPFCGGLVLDDGRILLCDSKNQVLEVHAADVGSVERWDRPRDEAGAFRLLSVVGRWSADSIVAVDRYRFTATIFDRAGTPARAFEYQRPAGPRGGSEAYGPLSDGSLLLVSYPLPESSQERFEQAMLEGAVLDSAEYGISTATGYTVVGMLPAGGEYRVRIDQAAAVLVTPLANRRITAAGGEAFVVAFTGDPEVTVFSPDGSVRQVVRHGLPPSGIENSDAAAIRSSFIDSGGPAAFREHRARLARIARNTEVPQYLDAVMLSPDGELLVSRPRLQTETASWHIYGENGSKLAVLDLPADLLIMEVLRDRVLTRNHDGSRVSLYRLDRD